jgi:DNA-binding NarL/FixJ family response regulator
MQTIIETSEKDSPTVIRKRIKQSIRSITNDAFWNELRGYIDKNYNNIITEISENPKISEKDLRLIELSLCGFDYVEIAITLGYRPEYISQKRREIAKKLNLGVSLNDYLEEIKL